MPNEILHPLKDFGVDLYGILGIGSFNWDYTVENIDRTIENNIVKLKENDWFRVVDTKRQKLLEILGQYTPDTTKVPGWNLVINDKHKSGLIKPNNDPLEFILGQGVTKEAGGGIINLGRAMVTHSSDIPMGITVLRGKGKIDDLVDGIVFDYVRVNGNDDPGNIVFKGANNKSIERTIARGQPYVFNGHVRLHPQLDFNVGTIVVNSIDSPSLTKAAIEYYNQRIDEGREATGIFCITPKMSHSYDIISKEAIPRGAITIFNPVDLVSYAFRDKSKTDEKNPILTKNEGEITYSDIFEAVKIIRKEQGNRPQRIYVTLGEYGCIGIGSSGSVYRTNVFETSMKRNNGAGDVFASMITRFEHRKGLSDRDYQSIYGIMAYASAAASVFCSGLEPTMGSVYSKVLRDGNLEFEDIGKIDLIETKCAKLQKRLDDVKNDPITTYSRLHFK